MTNQAFKPNSLTIRIGGQDRLSNLTEIQQYSNSLADVLVRFSQQFEDGAKFAEMTQAETVAFVATEYAAHMTELVNMGKRFIEDYMNHSAGNYSDETLLLLSALVKNSATTLAVIHEGLLDHGSMKNIRGEEGHSMTIFVDRTIGGSWDIPPHFSQSDLPKNLGRVKPAQMASNILNRSMQDLAEASENAIVTITELINQR